MSRLLKILLLLGGAAVVWEWQFRRQSRREKGRLYTPKRRLRWAENYVVPHPHLSFRYQPGHVLDEKKPLAYSLHPYRYYSNKKPLRINNYGHFGTDFYPTSPGEITVACVGASGTANSISDGERDYSFPGLLEETLRARTVSGVRVMNCGIGGWNSADMLVNYALNIIHLRPTYLVLYQGMLDIDLYLMPGFRSDYSHGRRNLGEVMGKIRLANLVPALPFLTAYEKWREETFGSGNVRDDVLKQIRAGTPDYNMPLPALEVEKQNFRSIIALARDSGTQVILATFAFYNYDGSKRFTKFSEGVAQENAFIRELAAEYQCPLVDVDALIPKTKDYFLDSNHFTPAGMQLIAGALADVIQPVS